MATTQEVNDYMMKKMKFIPRMYKIINEVAPDAGQLFTQLRMFFRRPLTKLFQGHIFASFQE